MVHDSKYGTRDGKSFEESLSNVFRLFREAEQVNIISGSGDTDILCKMKNDKKDIYKINVDAKTTQKILSQINPRRIVYHIGKNGSKYCVIVSPRFARGAKLDIKDQKIVTIEAETLATYCLKECLISSDGMANYDLLDSLISANLGLDITKILMK